MSKKNETRYKDAMRMVRDGMDHKTITQITGFSATVLKTIRLDMERGNNGRTL